MNAKLLSFHTCRGEDIKLPMDEILCYSSSRFTCNKCEGSMLYTKDRLIHVSERPSFISIIIHIANWD